MKNFAFLTLLASFGSLVSARAAIQNVGVLGSTATQAIVHYTAPDNSACNVEVSESPTYRPLVYDVDNTKFASASSDARPGSLSSGAERVFVIGKRAAEIGLDTLRYSRALQTATQHYFRVTCPSTGDRATGSFQTATIPFGASYAEAEAVDPNRPGSYAYPSLSSSDRTQQVIDPQTGLLIKRVTLPHDVVGPITGAPLIVARGAGWANLGNLAASNGSGATISGATGALYLALDPSAPFVSSILPYAAAYQSNANVAYGYFQAHLIAAVNRGGSAPVNPEDAKIVACLTVDGANCYAGGSQYEAVLKPSFADTVFGTASTIDLWQSTPGAATPSWPLQAIRQGTVFCDGSVNVQLATGSPFGSHWSAGSGIKINGVDYTIAALNHTAQLTLSSACPSNIAGTGSFDLNSRQFRTPSDTFAPSDNGRALFVSGAAGAGNPFVSNIDQVVDARTVILHDSPAVTATATSFGFPAAYVANNFGVLVRKKTASPDTVEIDYGSVNYGADFYFSFTLGGGAKLCSNGTVPGPNGRPGYNCIVPQGNGLYWVDVASGETHYFGNLNTSPNVGCGSQNQDFDPIDSDKYYCAGTGAIYSTKYYGNHSEPASLNPEGNMLIFQNLNNCNTSIGSPPYSTQQPCIVTQPLTSGTTLAALTAAFTANPAYAPAFDGTLFTNLQFKDIDGSGNIVFNIWRGGNNSIAWVVVFNPNATANAEGGSSTGALNNFGCVGGGRPGCVVAAMPSWARPGCRWCTIKSAESPYPGWTETAVYPWINSGPGTGPYYVPVIDGTANGTVNLLDGSASLRNCPANSFGASGLNCSMLTVASEPLSPNHGGGETGLPGELGPAMLGDRFNLSVSNSGEQMTLIAKSPGAQAGTWVYTLWRDINHPAGAHAYAASGPNPNLYAVCNSNQAPLNTNSGGVWYWNFLADPHGMNQSGTTIPPDPAGINDHYFWSRGNGGFASAVSGEARCPSVYYTCYATRLLKNRTFDQVLLESPTTSVITKAPAFGRGSADVSDIQSHPTGGGESAPADRFNFMFDGRPYRGGFSSGSVTGNGSNPAAVVSGQLYKFPATSMPNIDLPFRKVYPTAAFSGQTPLVDISGPATGNAIGGSTADAYKYCVASAANECRQGSSVGDVYVNAPAVRFPFCYGAAQNLNLADEYDLCIGGSSLVRDAIMQIDMTKVDNQGRYQRALTKFNRARALSVFYSPYVLPNGQWMMFESQLPGDGSVNKALLLAKIPPPAPQDNYNRLDFIPISITLPAFVGADSAYVRFGYAENGPASGLFCTSRKESCVVGRATAATAIDPANPFFLEGTEAASWSAAACSSGCAFNLPGISQRVLYYQFVYKNGAATVFTSPLGAAIVP